MYNFLKQSFIVDQLGGHQTWHDTCAYALVGLNFGTKCIKEGNRRVKSLIVFIVYLILYFLGPY